jgi:hypothetical protein
MTTVKRSVTRSKFRICENCDRLFEDMFFKNPIRSAFHCVDIRISVKVEVNAAASPIQQICVLIACSKRPSILMPETVQKGLICTWAIQ